jgi:hypothetical protein
MKSKFRQTAQSVLFTRPENHAGVRKAIRLRSPGQGGAVAHFFPWSNGPEARCLIGRRVTGAGLRKFHHCLREIALKKRFSYISPANEAQYKTFLSGTVNFFSATLSGIAAVVRFTIE